MLSSILIKGMAAARWNLQMAEFIGETTRIIREKDMEQSCIIIERPTRVNSWRVNQMVMEYTHGQMEKYIKDYLKRAKLKAKDTSDLLMAQNIMDSIMMESFMETE